MRRRPLRNGRRLAILAALAILAGSFLPWYALGGGGQLPTLTYQGLSSGSGILAFLAALGTLALVTLPYAAGDRPVGADRGLAYAALAALAVLGVALWVPGVLEAPEGLLPDRAPGFWLAAVGAIALARAAFEILTEPARP